MMRNRMKNRWIAGVLCLCIWLSMLPIGTVSSFAATNIPDIRGAKGSDFTNNSYIAGKLQTLFDNLPYSSYPYFTTYGNRSCGNNMCSACMSTKVAENHPNLKKLGVADPHACWSCFAFARYAFLYIFGITADGLNYYGNVDSGDNIIRVGRVARSNIGNISGSYDSYTLANLEALFRKATTGDIIQGNGTTGSGNHTMLFLSCDEEGVYVIQNNMFKTTENPDTGDAYGYNRVLISKLTYASIMSYWGNIVSILRAKDPYYSEVWGKTTPVCTKHSYTAAGGDHCVNCGALYTTTLDTSAAGLYRVCDTAATIRSTPYTPGSQVDSEPQGSYISVIGSLTNSIGERWYQLSSGNYTLGSNLEAAKAPDGAPTYSLTAYPTGALKQGASFNLMGKISGSSMLTTVRGCLVSENGALLQKATVSPEAKSLDVYSCNINYNLKFGSLAEGNYLFFLAATDESGRVAVFQSKFSISKNGGSYTPTTAKAPTLSGKTSSTVTLVAVSGMEYRMNDGKWQRSNLFEGLEPTTTYYFYQRVAATSTTSVGAVSPALIVTTDKYKETNTPKPILASRTDSTVRLKDLAGYEYSIDGKNWQKEPLFTELEPITSYLFYQRMAASETTYAGAISAALTVTTDKPTPSAPDAPTVLEYGENYLLVEEGELFEYSLDGEHWQSHGVFEGLEPGTAYACRARLRETELAYAGKPSEPTYVTTDRSYPGQPPMPTLLEKSGGTVHLQPHDGYEYSLDGMNWQQSAVFKGLTVSHGYTFYQRVAETKRNYASETSPGLTVGIIPGSLTSGNLIIGADDLTLRGIAPETPLRQVIAAMKESNYLRVYSKDGEQLTGNLPAATGMKLVICDGDRQELSYTLIVRGDLDGDGDVSVTDLALLTDALQKREAGEPSGMDGFFWLAADTDGSGNVDRLDLAILRKLALNGAKKEG